MFNSSRSVLCGSLLVLLVQQCRSQETPSVLNNAANLTAQLSDAKKRTTNADPQIAKLGFQTLQALARSGNTDAMAEVAKCYSDGLGVAKDPQLAYRAYLKASEAGSENGMFQLACCLLDGNGVAKSAANGMNWLTKAAERNNSDAIARLSEEYLRQYLSRNKGAEDVRKWSERGASLGIGSCQRILGICHQDGIGANADPKQAFHWYSKASNNGDVTAAVLLAYCHVDGIGIPVNEKKALLILKDAASGADAFAIHHFAANIDNLVVAKRAESPDLDPLEFSKRAKKSELTSEYMKEVVLQLQRAVEMEYAAAMNLLAAKYANGQGCEKDPKAAFDLAQKSQRTGNADGLCLLAEYYGKGIGTKANPQKSASLYGRGAKLGDPAAQYYFARCLAAGFGIHPNMEACKQWLHQSSANGNSNATQFLRQLEERQMAELRGWLDSMFSDSWDSQISQRRLDEHNRDQQRSNDSIYQRYGY